MINVVYSGQFLDPSGYGRAARDYLKALDLFIANNPEVLNLKVNVISFDQQRAVSQDIVDLVKKYMFKSNEEVQNFIKEDYILIGHHLPDIILNHPKNKIFYENTDNIINMTVWETTMLPSSWRRIYKENKKINNIIVPSNFNKDLFKKNVNTTADVYYLPHVIPEIESKYPRLKFASKRCERPFVILSVSQWTIRKGFDKLVMAYLMEFHDVSDVTLVIKSYRSNSSFEEQAIIKNEIRNYRNNIYVGDNGTLSNAEIRFIGDLLPEDRMEQLYSSCDVFALATRGEGFGLPYSVCASLGKPIIAPKFGGQSDFVNEDLGNIIPINGNWEPCYSFGAFYNSNMLWFEPSCRSIRLALRTAYNTWKDNRDRFNNIGIKAKHYVKSVFNYKAIGEKFVNIIQDVEKKKVNVNETK